MGGRSGFEKKKRKRKIDDKHTNIKYAEAKTLHVQVATEKHVRIISVNIIPVTGLPKIRDTTHGQQLERG